MIAQGIVAGFGGGLGADGSSSIKNDTGPSVIGLKASDVEALEIGLNLTTGRNAGA